MSCFYFFSLLISGVVAVVGDIDCWLDLRDDDALLVVEDVLLAALWVDEDLVVGLPELFTLLPLLVAPVVPFDLDATGVGSLFPSRSAICRKGMQLCNKMQRKEFFHHVYGWTMLKDKLRHLHAVNMRELHWFYLIVSFVQQQLPPKLAALLGLGKCHSIPHSVPPRLLQRLPFYLSSQYWSGIPNLVPGKDSLTRVNVKFPTSLWNVYWNFYFQMIDIA